MAKTLDTKTLQLVAAAQWRSERQEALPTVVPSIAGFLGGVRCRKGCTDCEAGFNMDCDFGGDSLQLTVRRRAFGASGSTSHKGYTS